MYICIMHCSHHGSGHPVYPLGVSFTLTEESGDYHVRVYISPRLVSWSVLHKHPCWRSLSIWDETITRVSGTAGG